MKTRKRRRLTAALVDFIHLNDLPKYFVYSFHSKKEENISVIGLTFSTQPKIVRVITRDKNKTRSKIEREHQALKIRLMESCICKIPETWQQLLRRR